MPVLQLTRELHQYNKHQQTKNQRDHTHPKLNWAAQREHASVRSTFGRSFSHNWTWSPASTGLNLPHQKRKAWGFNCSGMIPLLHIRQQNLCFLISAVCEQTVDWSQGTFVPAQPRKVQWHHRAGATPSAGWTPSPNDHGSMKLVPSDRWTLYIVITHIYINMCIYIYILETYICPRELTKACPEDICSPWLWLTGR